MSPLQQQILQTLYDIDAKRRQSTNEAVVHDLDTWGVRWDITAERGIREKFARALASLEKQGLVIRKGKWTHATVGRPRTTHILLTMEGRGLAQRMVTPGVRPAK